MLYTEPVFFQNDEYVIFTVGPFKKEQIVFYVLPGLKKYSEALQTLIHSTWEEALNNKKQLLYDGECYALINMTLQGNQLICQVQQTTYRSFFGTNVKNRYMIEALDSMANCMAACIVMETTDQKIVIGKRASHMAEGKEEWHIIGGTLEGTDGVPEHPFDLILKEMEEEAAVFYDDLTDFFCMGTGLSLYNNKPEFLFYAKLKMSSSEFIEKSKTASHLDEHDELICLDRDRLPEFIRDYNVAAIGKAAIDLYTKFLQDQKL